jgi:hypothetical protein
MPPSIPIERQWLIGVKEEVSVTYSSLVKELYFVTFKYDTAHSCIAIMRIDQV